MRAPAAEIAGKDPREKGVLKNASTFGNGIGT